MDMDRMLTIEAMICKMTEVLTAQNKLIAAQQKALMAQNLALKEVASNLGELLDAQIKAMERPH